MDSKPAKARALCDVAAAMTATDPRLAARIFTEAETVARSLDDDLERAFAMRGVAVAGAVSDPGRAEDIASAITSEAQRDLALRDIAVAVAATDPDRAEDVARTIDHEAWKAVALSSVARVLAQRGQASS